MSNEKCCNVCGKPFSCLPAESPMIHGKLWNRVLNYFGLTEHPGNDDSETTPKYCCTECMEKALGRKLAHSDIPYVPYNIYFALHRYYGLSVETVREIRTQMKHYVLNSPDFKSWKLQREHAYMNGVIGILQIIQSSEYDTTRLH